MNVILRDVSPDRVAAGMAAIRKLYDDAVKRRLFTKIEARAGMDRIFPAHTPVPLTRAELVLEAATEDLELKRKIFRDLGSRIGPATILATNTSALPVGELGREAGCPERVIGLHFFNPVHRLELVEVVRPAAASPATMEQALGFVHAIGKTPVVVRDAPGFLVNRILVPYLAEAGRLFQEGLPATVVDEEMLAFGMPMGPLRLIDEVGADTALHVAEYLAGQFGERMSVPQVLRRLVEAKQLGRKTRAGFYLYDRKVRMNPRVQHFVIGDKRADGAAAQQRMLTVMLAEAERCLADGIVGSADEVDLAMVLGTGFAPYTGGPLAYAQHVRVNAERRVAA
jgi:3-hydroxyacyl-CoA dehydrogenase/enoyl-CoA hydratase/3-hydroxybutyryl-CoA epimerase